EVDAVGAGRLEVHDGEVELGYEGVRSFVLAGNTASLHAGGAPGLPHPAGGGAELAAAVAGWESAPLDANTLDALLGRARSARASVTLWHLLQRVRPADRARVFDALLVSGVAPPRLEQSKAVALDSYTLQRWRTALEPSWVVTEPAWRRLWRISTGMFAD
ncbi:MAG: hypothetical protein H0W68_01440, partial [Gemmatimonadaceae bacterium]|nr:hypothetical protein [Gemmatimonadaceae bacterium]